MSRQKNTSRTQTRKAGKPASPELSAATEPAGVVVRRRKADGQETRGVIPRPAVGAAAAPSVTDEATFAAFHDMLGKVADTEIAALAGVPAEAVEQARQRRGIGAFAGAPARRGRGRPRKGTNGPSEALAAVADRLGKEPDDIIARELGIPRTSVGDFRRRRGIDAYRGHYERGPRSGGASAAPKAAAPAPRRAGRLNDFAAFIGVKTDSEVAEMANVSPSGVRKFRARRGIPAAVAARAAAPAAAAAAKSRSAGTPRASRLDAFQHLIGVETDAAIAAKAGVTVSGVRKYRARRGLESTQAAAPAAAADPVAAAAAAPTKRGSGRPRKAAAAPAAAPVAAPPAAPAAPAKRGPGRPRKAAAAAPPPAPEPAPAAAPAAAPVKRGPGRPRKAAAPAAAPKLEGRRGRGRSRVSKLDEHRDIVGVLFDSVVATITGMTGEGVRQYRKRHNIPAGNLREMPTASAVAPAAPAADIAPVAPTAEVAPTAPTAVVAPTEPAAVAKAAAPRFAFAVEARKGTEGRRFVVTGANLGEAAQRAVEACARRADGPWAVRAISEIDELIA